MAALAVLIGLDLAATWLYGWSHRPETPVGSPVALLASAREPGATKTAVYEAVFVLCAGTGNVRGLDQTSVDRLRYAAAGYASGRWLRTVGIGGHWRHNRAAGWSDVMSYWLRDAGVPAAAVFADAHSYDTGTNLDAIADLVQTHGWRSVVVLSSPLHLIRVRARLREHAGLRGLMRASNREQQLRIDTLAYLAPGQRSFAWRWRETHHEWAARLLAFLLTDEQYGDVMRWRRL